MSAEDRNDQSTLPPLRRVVTGHDGDHVAKVIMDGRPGNSKLSPTGAVSTLIWSSDECPSDIAIGEDVQDYGARILGTAPPSHGTRFTVIDFPPNTTGSVHRTESLDYIIVLTGEIEMQMDQSVVSLKAGDVMVQRGTNHGWSNRTDHATRVAFVLMDAKPIGVGHAVSGTQNAR